MPDQLFDFVLFQINTVEVNKSIWFVCTAPPPQDYSRLQDCATGMMRTNQKQLQITLLFFCMHGVGISTTEIIWRQKQFFAKENFVNSEWSFCTGTLTTIVHGMGNTTEKTGKALVRRPRTTWSYFQGERSTTCCCCLFPVLPQFSLVCVSSWKQNDNNTLFSLSSGYQRCHQPVTNFLGWQNIFHSVGRCLHANTHTF